MQNRTDAAAFPIVHLEYVNILEPEWPWRKLAPHCPKGDIEIAKLLLACSGPREPVARLGAQAKLLEKEYVDPS